MANYGNYIGIRDIMADFGISRPVAKKIIIECGGQLLGKAYLAPTAAYREWVRQKFGDAAAAQIVCAGQR